jgi:iron complex transport system ATP-binding protein
MVSLLEARALSYSYPGPIRAVDGVDISLGREEVVVICGPNGSGKSTLLRLLAGLLRPDAGEVRLDGRSLDEFSPRDRARSLAVVPQQLPNLPQVRVSGFVLAGRYARIDRWRGPQHKDHQAVELALAASDAAELADRRMTDLSGGQRQRVLLARALAQEAQVLLIDEPTNALDPEHQVQVFDLIAGLGRNRRGVLVVSHDLNLASQFATSVVLVKDGRVAGAGAPADVLRPEVLGPVYGEHLHYGRMPEPDGRPFVLPWLAPGERTGAGADAQARGELG